MEEKELRGKGTYPGITVLTAMPPGLSIKSGQSFTEQQCMHIVTGTENLMVDAYDEDGFILWTK